MSNDLTVDAVRLALGMQQLRAEVAGANIARANEPGFQAQRVDLAGARAWLSQAAAGVAPSPSGSAPSAGELASIVVDTDPAAAQVDAQVAEMVSASLEFQALGESLNRHFGLMRLAITGRSA